MTRKSDREKVSRPQEDRYREFAQYYTICWNATEAYERCSWTKTKDRRSSQSSATTMLKNLSVQRHIAEIQMEQRKRYAATAEAVIQEWARVAFSDIANYVEWQDGNMSFKDSSALDENTSRAIETLEIRTQVSESGRHTTTYKAKLWNKLTALEALSKHFGLYLPEKHDVNLSYGTVNVPALAAREDWMDVIRQEIGHVNGSTGAAKTGMESE